MRCTATVLSECSQRGGRKGVVKSGFGWESYIQTAIFSLVMQSGVFDVIYEDSAAFGRIVLNTELWLEGEFNSPIVQRKIYVGFAYFFFCVVLNLVFLW